MVALPRTALLAVSLPGLRLVILLASPAGGPMGGPQAAGSPQAGGQDDWAAGGQFDQGQDSVYFVTRRRVKGKLEASLMPCQAAQALAWQL